MKRVLASFALLPASVLAADTNDLPELAPAYAIMPPSFWEQHQTVIIIAAFALLAVVLLSLQVMLRPKTALVLSPDTVARAALAKLKGQPEDGKCLSEISQILRHYFRAAFKLPPSEMTTTEFYAALAANERIGNVFAKVISDFLQACDKEKFSPKTVAPPLNAVSRALELIEMAEKRQIGPVGAAK